MMWSEEFCLEKQRHTGVKLPSWKLSSPTPKATFPYIWGSITCWLFYSNPSHIFTSRGNPVSTKLQETAYSHAPHLPRQLENNISVNYADKKKKF